jgi:3-phosphoglycerate kinase
MNSNKNSKMTYIIGGIITMSLISSIGVIAYIYFGWWSVLITGLLVGIPAGNKVNKDHVEEEMKEEMKDILVDDWESYGEYKKH